jgi:hypothetical protein
VITSVQGRVVYESMTAVAARKGFLIAALLFLLQPGGYAARKHSRHKVESAPSSASLRFIRKDGSCVDGPIAKIDPKAVTIQQSQMQPVVIQRNDLLQVSQDDALLFSARSSWADVEAVRLTPHESFQFALRNGKTIKGTPLEVTDDGFVYKRALWLKKRYAKAKIVTVDYLRLRPESAAFDYFAQEGPAMLFFYPEFYDRLRGLEGRVPVRLYDALQPQSDAPLQCSRR